MAHYHLHIHSPICAHYTISKLFTSSTYAYRSFVGVFRYMNKFIACIFFFDGPTKIFVEHAIPKQGAKHICDCEGNHDLQNKQEQQQKFLINAKKRGGQLLWTILSWVFGGAKNTSKTINGQRVQRFQALLGNRAAGRARSVAHLESGWYNIYIYPNLPGDLSHR